MRSQFLLFCLMPAAVIAAADGQHSFQLNWHKNGFSKDVYVSLDRKEPFAAEPDTGGRDVYRGVLELGQGENKKQAGFLWDKSENTLFLDQNFDGDLTNDPNGIVKSDEQGGFKQDFKDISISLGANDVIFKYCLSAYFYSSGSYNNATFYVHSGYSGTCDLYGKWWQFQVCDPLRTNIEANSQFSMSQKSDVRENRISGARLPKSIFMDGHCYDLSFEFRKSFTNLPSLWCTLREKQVPTGTLLIKGQSIDQLVLTNGRDSILPDLSDEPVTVPAGTFSVIQFSLKFADKPSISAQINKVITIPEGGQSELAVGGPLKSSVDIQRKGNSLEFSYKIIGAGGEEYSSSELLGYEKDNKPTVSIYKGDTQLASGTFEYG